MVSDGGWWPLCSTGDEPGGSVAGGTFKQLEDSRESTASRAATAGNIFDRSTWRGSVAPSSGRRWECDVSPPCADRRFRACPERQRQLFNCTPIALLCNTEPVPFAGGQVVWRS